MHGDGTSLWTLTHSDDFAVGFAGLLAHPLAVGDAFTLTGDHAPTWNQIYTWLGEAAGVEPALVHVPSDAIAAVHPPLGPGLLGDKAHSMVFDNSKVKAFVPEYRATVPFAHGAGEIVEWFLADASRQTVDRDLDAAFDHLAEHARAFS